MTSSGYLLKIIRTNSISDKERKELQSKIRPIYRDIRKWSGKNLAGIRPSGSFEKGTAIRDNVDIDLLISLKNNTEGTLKEIYESLYANFNFYYNARKQNVSIGVEYNGIKIDLVPARKMPNVVYNHSIYVSKLDKWTKTNIHKHISIIKKSRHRNIIKLVKIWRNLHGLEFPSFLIELVVLKALKGRKLGPIDKRFLHVLHYLHEKFPSETFYDPANSNNKISAILNDSEKISISTTAKSSLEVGYWEEVVWGLYSLK